MKLVLALLAALVVLSAVEAVSVPFYAPPGPPTNYFLDYKKVHLVDYDGYNFLFRGNMPKNESQVFDLDGLLGFMRKRAEEQNISFPPDVKLFVISLNSLYNKPDTDIEEAFFQEHPEVGVFENWSLYKRYKNPFNMTEEDVAEDLKDPQLWGKDDFPNRMERVHELLTQHGEVPLAIYFHCETGCDRTGEFGAGYSMRWKKQTFQQTKLENTADCGRPANPSAEYMIGWYCYHLKFAFGIDACCNCTAAASKSSIVYVGVFLDEDSKQALLEAYPPHLHDVYVEHMTIAFQPSPDVIAALPWNLEVELTVVGYGMNDRAEAVVVSPNEGIKSQNKNAHVTISTAAGVNPVESNYMLAEGFTPVTDGIKVSGRVGGFVTGKGIVFSPPN